MKKLSTLALLLMMGVMSAWSQTENIFCFIDKNGNTVENGAVLTITDAEDDGWGGVILPSGLSVKNTTGEEASLRIHCELQTLDNGVFQICFPTNCLSREKVETFVTPSGSVDAGAVKDILSEWLPETYGKCKVVYQIEVMKMISLIPLQYESLGMGSSITVEYVYSDNAGVNAAVSGNEPSAYYNLNGTKFDAPQRGLNIIRMKNGQVVKQMYR